MGASASVGAGASVAEDALASGSAGTTTAGHALLVQLRTATNFPLGAAKANAQHQVRAVVEAANGGALSACVQWMHRGSSTRRHVWRQWRRIDFSPEWTTALLRFDLFGGEPRLGTVSIPVDSLLGTSQLTDNGWGPVCASEWDVPLDDESSCTLSLALRVIHEPTAFAAPRIIFAVRHAESLWNRAVACADVVSMLGKDHGLSAQGMCQAVDLSLAIERRLHMKCATRIPGEAKTVDELEALFLTAFPIYSSPMKRAVQTSILAFRTHPSAHASKVRLLPVAREVRGNYGRDNVVCARGDDIYEHALRDIRLNACLAPSIGDGICSLEGSSASTPKMYSTVKPQDTHDADSILGASPVECDAEDTEDVWWSVSTEDAEEAKRRATEFLEFVKFAHVATETCIVVTHSNFLRHVFKTHSSLDEFARRKVANCAVVAMRLDFGGTPSSTIVDAQFLFGTGFDDLSSHKSPSHLNAAKVLTKVGTNIAFAHRARKVASLQQTAQTQDPATVDL